MSFYWDNTELDEKGRLLCNAAKFFAGQMNGAFKLCVEEGLLSEEEGKEMSEKYFDENTCRCKREEIAEKLSEKLNSKFRVMFLDDDDETLGLVKIEDIPTYHSIVKCLTR